MSHPLELLISKLNDTTRRAAEEAVVACKRVGQHEVDIEHMVLALLAQGDNDLQRLCRHAEVAPDALRRDLEQEVARFPAGSSRPPVFSVHLPRWLEQAWLIASLEAPTARIRSGHLLLAWLTEPQLRQVALRSAPRLASFDLGVLKHRMAELTSHSPEAPLPLEVSPGSPMPCGATGTEPRRTPALDQFTTNLTDRAAQGQLDPVIGRESEVRQAMDILLRRRQNNPLLVGEAGVGKTAVVEGLAQRIATGDVPTALKGVRIHVLDMGRLQAGASVKGEFERRLQGVIEEVRQGPHPIVLFIDEAHALMGAGGPAGGSDAANLLKPALARGELRTIAATTWGEYKQHIEKDAALSRRFQLVKVDEPSEPVAATMLRAMAPLMARHFGVQVLDEAITEAVRLSARYITGRQLPDKAVSLLDTACARVAMGQGATPARIEDARRHIEHIEREVVALQAEHAARLDGAGARSLRLEALGMARLDAQRHLAREEARWAEEHHLVQAILAWRQRAMPGGAADTGLADESELQALQARLRQVQDGAALVPLQVDAAVVADIVSAWTGVPLGQVLRDELDTVRHLEAGLRERVVGQDHALAAIARRVRTARAGLEDPDKPRGVFLFVGPSGVGKTETALALADLLYGGERNLITINMSEYQEAHSVSGLKGAPPGYVGHGQGGVLTEAVRRKPHSVILLDEVEKAHPDVLELFFQVFDKGRMDDAEGREVDFRQALIILTSNAGSAQVMQACMAHDEAAGGRVMHAPDDMPSADALAHALQPVLSRVFKPALLGRTLVVPYHPLHDDVLAEVVRLKLARIARRMQARHGAELVIDDALVEAVLARCTEVDSGARAVDHILTGQLLPQLADQVLCCLAEGQAVQRVRAGVGPQGEFCLSWETA